MIHTHTEGIHTDGTYIQNGGTNTWSDIHMKVHAHKGDMRTERIYTRRDIHMEDMRTKETARHTHGGYTNEVTCT